MTVIMLRYYRSIIDEDKPGKNKNICLDDVTHAEVKVTHHEEANKMMRQFSTLSCESIAVSLFVAVDNKFEISAYLNEK